MSPAPRRTASPYGFTIPGPKGDKGDPGDAGAPGESVIDSIVGALPELEGTDELLVLREGVLYTATIEALRTYLDAPTVPEAIVDFTVTPIEGGVSIDIGTLPFDGGSALTALEYRIDGGTATALEGTDTGPRDVIGLTPDVAVDVEVRASNAVGDGPWSAVQSATPEAPPVPVTLPPIADDNATFTDEGTATTGWTASNGTLGVTSGVLRLTKTSGSGSSASMTKAITTPGSNKDFLFMGNVKCSRAASSHAGAFWLRDAGNTRQFVIWLNYDSVAGAYAQGTISIQAYEGATLRTAVVATGVNTETANIEFALQYDHKWSTMNCFLRQTDNTWDLKARIACTFHTYTDVQAITMSAAPAATWMEFSWLMVARPNIIVIGDSIAEGKTLYSPNRSLGLANYSSTWARYANLYPSLRNNVVFNKGVGSETSTATLARIADATGQGARVVFLHASTNDQVNGVSLATRTTNTQSMITAIKAASAEVMLLNAMYGTSTFSFNPAHRDYAKTWWGVNRLTLTDVYGALDIMQPLLSGGYMADALTQADDIHPTPGGHEDIGLQIGAL